MSDRIQCTFTVSKRLFDKCSEHSKDLGLNFPEYIRYLLAKEIDRLGRIEVMDLVTEERILLAIQDLQAKKVSLSGQRFNK